MDGLTPDEDAELKQLEAQQADYEHQKQGVEAIDTMDQQRVKTPEPTDTRPFSLRRVFVGGMRDAAQGIEDTLFDIAPYMPGSINPEATKAELAPIHKALTLPEPAGSDQAGTAERIGRALVSFMAPFGIASKALKVTKAASWLGRAGKVMLAGAATDFATLDPKSANFANFMKDTFGIDNPTLNELAAEPDDNRLVARFKAAAVNAPLSIATDALMEAGLRGVRAYRAFRGSLDEADAAVRAARGEAPVADVELPEPAPAEGAPPPEGAPKAASTAPDKLNSIRPTEPAPENTSDILDFLKEKTAEGASEEDVAKIADELAGESPENALTRAGINPLKVDFSALDDPEALGKFSAGLQNIYEAIAQRLGRTGIRVTEGMTARAARVMASTADTLKDLYGHTRNLDAIMYASQAIVGAHAAKLLGQAKLAMEELKAGATGPEWDQFVKDFERHAYFLGALRGAGSEVGRALGVLRRVQKVGKNVARATMKQAQKSADQAFVGAGAARSTAKEAVGNALDTLVTDADKVSFLGKLIDKKGDIGNVSRFVRTKANSGLVNRLDNVVRETLGNLFTSATAVRNTLSGMVMIGATGLAKSLATISALARSPFGKEYAQAARVQLMDTWAYVDGAFGGWRMAIKNTLALLEREGMEEIAINLQGVGAEGLAKRASLKAEEGRAALTGEFERVDISNRARAFAMSPADLQTIHSMIDTWKLPDLMKHTMKALVQSAAITVNAGGSLSRLGTILFINASDQFVGTMSARAGAQAEAMRIAAHEAAELQLEGKDLTAYMKARMVQLTETAGDGFADDAYSAGRREAVMAAGQHEAAANLFQDDLELGISRSAMRLSHTPFFSLIVAFVKTPLRILERTAIDFTPLGLLKDRMRADILAGGARRDEALAKIGLGMTAVYTAFQLAESRGIVGGDGGYQSTARLARPNYSLKIGDDYFQFNSIDPLGTLLGWGADVRAYLDQQEDNPDASGKAMQMFEAALVATQKNIFAKTWLASLQNLADLVDASDGKEFSTRLHNYLNTFATRITPGAGIQRGIAQAFGGEVHDASSFMDKITQTSIGANTLPIKRDPILGKPIPVDLGTAIGSVKSGPMTHDPLLRELDKLSFGLPAPHRDIEGVKLTSAQYYRMLELAGQVVTKDSTGLNKEEALRKLIALPEYQSLPRAGRIQAIRDETRGYQRLAEQQLLSEDKDLALKVAQRETYNKLHPLGATQDQVDQQTQDFAKELGLVGQDQNIDFNSL